MKFFFLLLLIPYFINAQIVWQSDTQEPIAISIKMNSQQIALNGLLEIDAEFHYPSSYHLNLEKVLDRLTWSANPLAPRLSLFQSTITPLSIENNQQGQRLHAEISPLMIGTLYFSFLNVEFLPKDNSKPPIEVLTPVFSVKVLPLQNQENLIPFAPLIPLVPQFPLSLTQKNQDFLIDNPQRLEKEKRNIKATLNAHTFPWLTLAALLACGGIAWAGYLLRGYLPKRAPKPIPVISSKEKANQALSELKAKSLIEQGSIKNYYYDLSFILLKAVTGLTGRESNGMTTNELANFLQKETSLTSKQKNEIISLLTEMDRVKFSDKTPPEEDTKLTFQNVQAIVKEIFP